jgi:hypothetical protein
MYCRKSHQIVHLGERHHGSLAARAGPGILQVAVHKLKRARRCQETRTGIEGDLEAHGFQFARGKIGRAAALHHVRQQGRSLECLGDTTQLLQALGAFNEQYIGAGLEESLGPAQRRIDPFGVTGVRARNNEKVAARPCVDRNTDLGDGVIGGNDATEFGVAAFLRKLLVLDLNAGGARGSAMNGTGTARAM